MATMPRSPSDETNSAGKDASSLDLSNTLRGSTFGLTQTQQTTRQRYWELFWEHKHVTITMCFGFGSFGTCVAFLGPTLLDLGCKTSTVFPTLSWVFFSQSVFILLGSACAGFMLKRFSSENILLVGTVMMTVTMLCIPLCDYLWLLGLALSIMGFFMGTIDTVANVSMICIYGKDVSPFLQAIHFFYGVGAFVSPMIAEPFLLNQDCSPFISNSSLPLFPEDKNDTQTAKTLEEAQNMTQVNYAFVIMALTMVPVVLLSFSLVAKKQCLRLLGGPPPDKDEKAAKDYQDMGGYEKNYSEEKVSYNGFKIALVTLLAALLMFLYDGLQASYGGYISSYALQGPAKFPGSDATYLNALFWGTFAAGRLLSIILATSLTPSVMLFCNIMGCNVSLLLMLSLRYNGIMLIIGTCMLGIFMSSVFPTTLSLTEQYIHINPTTTSFLVFGAALGEMSMPVLVGHEFSANGPTSLLVIGLVLSFISIIAYMSLWLAGLTLVKPDSTPGIMVFFTKCMPATVMKMEGENTSLNQQNVQLYSRMRTSFSMGSDHEGGMVNFVRKEAETSQ